MMNVWMMQHKNKISQILMILIGFTFPHEHKEVIQMATVIQKCDDSDSYLIDLMDGSRVTIEYNLLLEKFNSSDEDGDPRPGGESTRWTSKDSIDYKLRCEA